MLCGNSYFRLCPKENQLYLDNFLKKEEAMIYERIKTEADQMGLTIAELEKKSGLGNGVIGGWRTASPNARKLEAVADTLGVSVDYLLKGKKGRRFHERLFNESLYTVSKDGQYKWQLYEDTFDGHDSHGKKMQRKCKVLLYWSAADAIVARKKREEKVKRALKALENNAYTTDHSKEKYLVDVH